MLIKEIKVDKRAVTRIKKYIEKMPKAVSASLRKAIAAEARLVMKKSQELVPVRTGLLKRSKFLNRAKSIGGRVVISMGYRVKPGEYPAASGGSRKVVIDYAPIVEQGSSAYGVNFTGRFFMRRAFALTKPGRAQRIAKFVRQDLKKLRT